jgi:hypothetical protein
VDHVFEEPDFGRFSSLFVTKVDALFVGSLCLVFNSIGLMVGTTFFTRSFAALVPVGAIKAHAKIPQIFRQQCLGFMASSEVDLHFSSKF